MRRREFITLLGGATVVWPLAARAQQTDRVRRIGALMGFGENDAEGTLWFSSFTRALSELGWVDGRNVRMDVRWSASNTERERIFAKELISLQPDVILAHGTPVTAALRQETQMIPIVFGAVADPVGEGFVESLSRPGGNITGFLFSEAGIGGKWLELRCPPSDRVRNGSLSAIGSSCQIAKFSSSQACIVLGAAGAGTGEIQLNCSLAVLEWRVK
jgi:ABC transporter substrate binding protein